jgi:two-component system, chemotaxis family, sensor kinase Cph1
MMDDRDWVKQCEAEPLAYSGAIQPHGGLICLDANQRISHASAQLDAFLPYPPASLLGQLLPEELDTLLSRTFAQLALKPGARSELTAVSVAGNPSLDIVLTRGNDAIIIEFFQHQDAQIDLPHHSSIFKAPRNSQDLENLHANVAQMFYALTGFDRVMVYAFRQDGDGEVLAEDRRSEVYGSYLGLRFPGSDIPQIARNLYLKNPWRLIPDSHATNVPLLSNCDAPPDLSWSDLRSVSPVHQVYLNNMGVRASLSFPVVVAGELWGLIACHHADIRCPSLEELRVASKIARQYSFVLSNWQAESRIRFIDSLTSHSETLRTLLLRHGNIPDAMPEIAPILFSLFNVCGMAVRFNDDWATLGDVPTLEVLEFLDEWFESSCSELVSSSDSLVRTHPSIGNLSVAGSIALKVHARNGDILHLWMFRMEQLHDVEWGGNPQKPIEFDDGNLSVAPRRSFEKWVEKRMGYSRPWNNENRLVMLRLRQLLMEIYG